MNDSTVPDLDRVRAERWDSYQPPTRPSAGDLDVYGTALEQVDAALLLGSTPEIRTLARRHGVALTAVDSSAHMYRSMERLVDGDNARERFVECDWLDMSLDRTFDLVIADGSIGMLHPGLHERFFERLTRHTCEGGRVMMRVSLMGEPPLPTPEDVLALARRSRGHFYSLVKLTLSQLWLDPGTGAIPNQEFQRQWAELHRQGLTTAAEHRLVDSTLDGAGLTVFYIDRQSLLDLAEPAFDVEAVVEADDYDTSASKPVFVLRRRELRGWHHE